MAGASANAITLPTSSAGDGVLSGTAVTRGALLGLTVAETAGATAKLRLRDGTSTGTILVVVTLGPNESVRDWFGEAAGEVSGLNFSTTGIYAQVVSGAIEGSAYVRA